MVWKSGFYFDQPGHYRIRAVYAALDGSEVLSNMITIRVRYPVTAADEVLADLFMGDEQGTLLSLQGSDADCLRRGNDAFNEVAGEARQASAGELCADDQGYERSPHVQDDHERWAARSMCGRRRWMKATGC